MRVMDDRHGAECPVRVELEGIAPLKNDLVAAGPRPVAFEAGPERITTHPKGIGGVMLRPARQEKLEKNYLFGLKGDSQSESPVA
jgi:hypothetical protein